MKKILSLNNDPPGNQPPSFRTTLEIRDFFIKILREELKKLSPETRDLIIEILKGEVSKKHYSDLLVTEFAWYIAEHYLTNKSLEGFHAILQELKLVAPILFAAGFITRTLYLKIVKKKPTDNEVPWLLSALMAAVLAAGQSVALTAGAELSNWLLRRKFGFQMPRVLAGVLGAGFGNAMGEFGAGTLRIIAENGLTIKHSKVHFFLEFRRLCEEFPGAFLGNGIIWYLLDSFDETQLELWLQTLLSLVVNTPGNATFARFLSYVLKATGVSIAATFSTMVINKSVNYIYECVVDSAVDSVVDSAVDSVSIMNNGTLGFFSSENPRREEKEEQEIKKTSRWSSCSIL